MGIFIETRWKTVSRDIAQHIVETNYDFSKFEKEMCSLAVNYAENENFNELMNGLQTFATQMSQPQTTPNNQNQPNQQLQGVLKQIADLKHNLNRIGVNDPQATKMFDNLLFGLNKTKNAAVQQPQQNQPQRPIQQTPQQPTNSLGF